MRWDNLFDDLESQLEQELSAEEVDLRAEEERLRVARLSFRDRLMSLQCEGGTPAERMLRLTLCDGSRVAVTPSTFGRDWLAGELNENTAKRPGCIVPLEAIAALVMLREQIPSSLEPRSDGETERSLSARLGLGFVLRDLCRRRRPLELRLRDGMFYGTLDRVGRDHCDLAVHEPGGVRRESAVTEYRTVLLNQLLLVRL